MSNLAGKKKSRRQYCLIAACAAISAQFAFGESVSVVSETFEGDTYTSPIWSGSGGTIAEASYDSATKYLPVPSAKHTKVLNIAGDVFCKPDGEKSANTIDLMVKLTAVDELEDPDNNPQVALAVAANGNNVDLKIYAKAKSDSSAGWITLKEGLTPETWARLTLVFDYTAGTVSVCYNCEYVNKYYLVSSGTKINSLTFSGSTSIDDVVMTATAVAEYNPYVDASGNAITNQVTVGNNETLGVSLNDLAKWGVSASADLTKTTAPDNSGMTIADKLVAGLTPTDDKKFELETMTITANNATLTFPGSAPNNRYTIVATDKDKNPVKVTTTLTDADGGGKQAVVEIPNNAPSVIYFKVQAKVKAAVPAAN